MQYLVLLQVLEGLEAIHTRGGFGEFSVWD